MIAGAALERATSRRWEDLLREHVFAPLRMTSCGFGPPGSRALIDQPWGHDPAGTAMAPTPAADNPPGLGPAGTMAPPVVNHPAQIAGQIPPHAAAAVNPALDADAE